MLASRPRLQQPDTMLTCRSCAHASAHMMGTQMPPTERSRHCDAATPTNCAQLVCINHGAIGL